MTIRIKTGEILEHVESGDETFELEANSQLKLTRITFAEQDISQKIEVRFLGTAASCELKFLDLASNSSKLETIVTVKHQASNCQSTVLHKGLYKDQSRGFFKAMVEVDAQTVDTNASQLHRSLLLSPNASSHAEPHLKIQTDAVKCKHGVSIGQLDHKALFYLIARGLDEQSAKRLLIGAFAKEIIGDHPEHQEQVMAWI